MIPKQVVGQRGPIWPNAENLYFFEREPNLEGEIFILYTNKDQRAYWGGGGGSDLKGPQQHTAFATEVA